MVAMNKSPGPLTSLSTCSGSTITPSVTGTSVDFGIPPTLPQTNRRQEFLLDSASQQEIIPLPEVIKGRSDWREYRPFQLANGVTCVLVHDKQSKSTAMSVAVDVGASSDPRSISGLAHFTEHMCFLGSDKYPGENEYKKYLSKHGGHSNASTSMSFTTYKFDILSTGDTSNVVTEKAVDIFSQFFICPLFSESGTSREVQAVDSENTRNMADDARRRLQVLKALANPRHHFSKFSTGNKNTLVSSGLIVEDSAKITEEKKKDDEIRTDAASNLASTINSTSECADSNNNTASRKEARRMRKALLAFHRRHYKPKNMVCVIVGPQSLDQLQEWIVPRFSTIYERPPCDDIDDEDMEIEKLIEEAAVDAPPTRFDQPLPDYDPAFTPSNQGGRWPILLTVDPLKQMRKLILLFPLPSVYKSEASPVAFLSHLIGHEGSGSPFAILQDAGLVNSVSTGSRISAPDQCLFQIEVNLTEKGEQEWRSVVQIFFEYIRLIQASATQAIAESMHDGNASGANGNATKCVVDCTPTKDQVNPSPSNSILRRIWDEVTKIQVMNFNFASPGSAYDLAPALAQSVMVHGTKYCLSSGRQMVDDIDVISSPLFIDQILNFVSKMNPDNCLIERCSKEAWREQLSRVSSNFGSESCAVDSKTFGIKREPWYGVEYILSPIDSTDVALWKIDRCSVSKEFEANLSFQSKIPGVMHLPLPNRFLPRNLDLCPDLPPEARAGPRIEKDIEPPKLIREVERVGRLWHRLDDRYSLPKASIAILLRNALVEHNYEKTNDSWEYDERSSLCSLLLINMFTDGLAQVTYDAGLSGLSWSFSKSTFGINISCGGYSDRLPELAILLIRAFIDDTLVGGSAPVFIKEQFFIAAKDKVARSLKSYFQSGRADSHALFYRDFVLSGRSKGVEYKLNELLTITFEDVKEHHQRIVQYPKTEYDCLVSGNISGNDAITLFESACNLLQSAKCVNQSTHLQMSSKHRIPGPFARQLKSGEDTELHFASQNPEEQNGAVIVTFQSSLPSFKGSKLSSMESLKQTAAIRLISHILREPFFNELRTKQQLGYVVQSAYDLTFSSQNLDGDFRNSKDEHSNNSRSVTPIDSIVVNILSKNTDPVEVVCRIDDFLHGFRDSMIEMPLSEIKDHATSLSRQLTKPIQNLGDEVSLHFGKIQLYAPEILHQRGSNCDIPWSNAQILASEIERLERKDILQTWDDLVVSKDRSRIVSFVYGKAFPLDRFKVENGYQSVRGPLFSRQRSIHYTLDSLLTKRMELTPFNGCGKAVRSLHPNARQSFIASRRNLGLAALTVFGLSLLKFVLVRGDEKRDLEKSK